MAYKSNEDDGEKPKLTGWPGTAYRTRHMRKVTNHQALVHGIFTLDADTRSTSLAAIRGIYICGIHAELDGVGGSIDRDEACGDGRGLILVSWSV